MPAPTPIAADARFNAIDEEARRKGERNDCGVKALAIVTGASYYDAHHTLRLQGRVSRKGCSVAMVRQAVAAMGFQIDEVHSTDFIRKYPKPHNSLKSVTTHHMDRFNKVWADGNTYLVFTKGHVLAVVDGVNLDWTRGSAKRATSIWKISAK